MLRTSKEISSELAALIEFHIFAEEDGFMRKLLSDFASKPDILDNLVKRNHKPRSKRKYLVRLLDDLWFNNQQQTLNGYKIHRTSLRY